MATITEPADLGTDVGRTAGDPGDRFVGAGLILMAVLFVSVQVLAGEVIPPLAVPAALYALVGVVVLRSRRRWLLPAVVGLVTLHLVSSLPFLAAGLAHPETPASFIPDAAAVILGMMVVVAAALGWRAAHVNRRPLAVVAGVAVAACVLVSVVAARGVDSEAAEPGDVTVEALRATFPEEVVVAAGGSLWVDNQDAFRHTLVVEGTDVHVEMPGSTAVRIAVDLTPGTYRYFCDVPGHERMEGQLVVE